MAWFVPIRVIHSDARPMLRRPVVLPRGRLAILVLPGEQDRLEHIANFDTLLRQMLGVPETAWGAAAKVFNHQTLRDNVALVDEALLHQINALIAASGRE